ncbi:MAG: hypothetical protein JSV96_12220 [Candidatus Aminicenantes bacterium]|nr:MAG: hypothetical protein JSV96_12220 [Candidatus Aminicenantes bacterium]
MIVEPSRQVLRPSTGLLVTGIVGGIIEVTVLIAEIIGRSIDSFWRDEIPGDYLEFFETGFSISLSLVGLLVAAFIIYASLKMKDLNQWGLCVAASILAMIPCVSPCCIIGLPVGIWCLVVLMRPEVKDAFR